MNVTTVYELFSVIMQETFQHNNDFSITYKTNLCRFTQMQVGTVIKNNLTRHRIFLCLLYSIKTFILLSEQNIADERSIKEI